MSDQVAEEAVSRPTLCEEREGWGTHRDASYPESLRPEPSIRGVKWRQGRPEDMERLHELWDEQERRFAGTGVKVDRPDLTRAPVMAVRVAERDGAVVGFYHVE